MVAGRSHKDQVTVQPNSNKKKYGFLSNASPPYQEGLSNRQDQQRAEHSERSLLEKAACDELEQN